MLRHTCSVFVFLPFLTGQLVAEERVAIRPFRIEIVEQTTRWPVPLVQLRTTSGVRFVSDNAGAVAIAEPDLMEREVFLHVAGQGYEVAKDGFGYRGVRVTPRPGQSTQVEVTRSIIAQRLGRLTGAGQFADSQQLGRELDWRESGVVGCDSVQIAVHQGRRFFLWGDTTVFQYPLGIFHASGATTDSSPLETAQPPLRVRLDYFTDSQGRPREIARMAGEGPTWLSGCLSLPDRKGKRRLVATYAKIQPPLDAYRYGLCEWNDESESFEHIKTLWRRSEERPDPPPLPTGHPALWRNAKGDSWVLFGNPLPTLRCPATYAAWQDPAQWQVLEAQETIPTADHGPPLRPHSGSIAWNAYRGCWITVFLQSIGEPSAFGELWYAEAGAPTGPWGPAVKILSHDNYTFYNPRIHTDWSPESRILLFEGTYTAQFADKPEPTPRYDYNQILYRLNLDDERLHPAQKR